MVIFYLVETEGTIPNSFFSVEWFNISFIHNLVPGTDEYNKTFITDMHF
jgi:hypothetical protein